MPNLVKVDYEQTGANKSTNEFFHSPVFVGMPTKVT